jgi:hypothetical protein
MLKNLFLFSFVSKKKRARDMEYAHYFPVNRFATKDVECTLLSHRELSTSSLMNASAM